MEMIEPLHEGTDNKQETNAGVCRKVAESLLEFEFCGFECKPGNKLSGSSEFNVHFPSIMA
jgi:hypothetical protein